MFTKHEIKSKKFVAVCWSYGKWCISVFGNIVPVCAHLGVKVSILTCCIRAPSFVKIPSGI